MFKRASVFLILLFAFCIFLCGAGEAPAFASSTNCYANDIVKFVNISQTQTIFHQFFVGSNPSVGDGEGGGYTSTEITLLNSSNIPLNFSYAQPENPSSSDRIVLIDEFAPQGITSLKYTGNNFELNLDEDYFALPENNPVIYLKYSVMFSFFEDEQTVNTTITSDITIYVHNIDFNFVLNEYNNQITSVDCVLNEEKQASWFMQFVDFDASSPSVQSQDIEITFSQNYSFYKLANFSVYFTYTTPNGFTLGGDEVEFSIKKTLTVVMSPPEEWTGLTLNASYGATMQHQTTLNLGDVEYSSAGINITLHSNAYEGVIFSLTSDDFSYTKVDLETQGDYSFTIVPNHLMRQAVMLTISSNFYGYTSSPVTVSFNYIVSGNPQINLTTDAVRLNKGSQITRGFVISRLPFYIATCIDVDGSVISTSDIVIDYSSITDDYLLDSDIIVPKTYVINYSYINPYLSDKIANASLTVTVFNSAPTLGSGNIHLKVAGSAVLNNAKVLVNQPLEVTAITTDSNGDETIFVIKLLNNSHLNASVVSNAAGTHVNASETSYLITGNNPAGNHSINFKIVPNNNYIGQIEFQIYSYDDITVPLTSTKHSYSFSYYEQTPPTINLNTSTVLGNATDGYTMQVVINQAINFASLIVSVADDIDTTLTAEDVVIALFTSENLPLTLTENSYTFTTIANYNITYSLTDHCQNITTKTVLITVTNPANHAPTAQNINLQQKSYTSVVIVNLATYATDQDANTLTYVRSTQKGYDGYGVTINKITNIILNPNSGVLTISQDIADTSKIYVGTFHICYKVWDGYEYSNEGEITIEFIDDIAPVIRRTSVVPQFVIGKSAISSFNASAFFVAEDAVDGIITPTLEYSVPIDLTTVGNYTITYTFIDGSGNASTQNIVYVVGYGLPPAINLTETTATITAGEAFDIFNFIENISDFEDGTNSDVNAETQNLIITGMPQDMTVAGEYQITITYTDSDGNLTSINFNLVVESSSNTLLWVLLGVVGGIIILGGGVLTTIIIVQKRRF